MPGFKIQVQLLGESQRTKLALPEGSATTVSHLRQLIAIHTGVNASSQRMRLASSKPGQWLELGRDGESPIGDRIQSMDRLEVKSEPMVETRAEEIHAGAPASKRIKLSPTVADDELVCVDSDETVDDEVIDLCSSPQPAEDRALNMLTNMGFDEGLCRRAIAQCGTAEAATEWLLQHQKSEPAAEPAATYRGNSSATERVGAGNIDQQRDTIKFLTWNIWFDPLEQPTRMKAMGDIIQKESPDFVALQEVTADLFSLLAAHPFIENYIPSRPPSHGVARSP